MGVRLRYRDKDEPPRHGPFARHVWEPARGEWVVTLNGRGRRAVASLLADYGGHPVRCLNVPKHRWLFRAARDLMADPHHRDDVRQAAHLGVVHAVRLFETRGPAAGAALKSHMTVWVANEVYKAVVGRPIQVDGARVYPRRIERRMVRLDGLAEFGGDDAGVGHLLAGRDPEPAASADDALRAERMLRSLPPRYREVVERCVMGGQTLRAAAGEIGVSRERVRQILAAAVLALRRRFADPAAPDPRLDRADFRAVKRAVRGGARTVAEVAAATGYTCNTAATLLDLGCKAAQPVFRKAGAGNEPRRFTLARPRRPDPAGLT